MKRIRKQKGKLYPVTTLFDGQELMTGIEPSENGIKIVDQWIYSFGCGHLEINRKTARKLAKSILECLEDTK